MTISLVLIAAYLFGAIPFGLILCKLFGYGDIRAIGSGNIGATNVLRTGNKLLALATFLLDTGKGALAVLVAQHFVQDTVWLWAAGFAAILGHNYPLWLGFKGGKGVATSIGTLFALNWWLGGAMCVIWLWNAFLYRTSSLSALSAFALLPAFTLLVAGYVPFVFAAALTVLIFWRHRTNIVRLIDGVEPKMSEKNKGKK